MLRISLSNYFERVAQTYVLAQKKNLDNGWGKACGEKEGNGYTVEVNKRKDNAPSKIFKAGRKKEMKNFKCH